MILTLVLDSLTGKCDGVLRMTCAFLLFQAVNKVTRRASAVAPRLAPHPPISTVSTIFRRRMSVQVPELIAQQVKQTPAAYDFRSDTVTTPTQRMLNSMVSSSHGDAVFNEDETTNAFETHIASLLGMEKGLFVPSGTAGNQIAMRVHLTQPPHSVLCDHRSHIAVFEAGGMASLSQALLQPVIPRNGIYLTLEDVEKAVVLLEDIHYAPTRVICLENTLGGVILPLDEIKRISEFARNNGIKLHLDGARLWNACAAGAGTLVEFGREFDSISLCFSKGLGAPVGSVLVGNAAFIKKANWIRKSIGGGMRQTGVLTNAAWTALEEVYPKLPDTHAIAKEIEEHFKSLGLKTTLPVQTNMIFIDLQAAKLQNSWFEHEAKERGVKFGFAGRIVVHHQICREAVSALKEAVAAVLRKVKDGEYKHDPTEKEGRYGSMSQSEEK